MLWKGEILSQRKGLRVFTAFFKKKLFTLFVHFFCFIFVLFFVVLFCVLFLFYFCVLFLCYIFCGFILCFQATCCPRVQLVSSLRHCSEETPGRATVGRPTVAAPAFVMDASRSCALMATPQIPRPTGSARRSDPPLPPPAARSWLHRRPTSLL